MKRVPPPIERADNPDYRQLWRLVDGEIASCFKAHPDYLPVGQTERTIRTSLAKRIVGKILGYESQRARRVGPGPVRRPKQSPALHKP